MSYYDEAALSAAIGDRLPGHRVRLFDCETQIAVAWQVGDRRNGIKYSGRPQDFDPAVFADEAVRALTEWASK